MPQLIDRRLNPRDKSLGNRQKFLRRTKAQTWAMAMGLGGEDLVELIREESHTCYLGRRDVSHDWGYGCGACPACELRANGWRDWVAEGRPAIKP